jgi:hypothetical protein
VSKLTTSPSTKRFPINVRNVPGNSSTNTDIHDLHQHFRHIHKCKISKKYSQLQHHVAKLKATYSIRQAAKKLGMTYSELHRYSSVLSKANEKSVMKSDLLAVEQFLNKSNVSQPIPYKKYANKRYLRQSLQETYKMYVGEQKLLGNRVLSKTAMYNAKPKHIKCMGKIPFRDCQCSDCVNHSLLADALLAINVKGITRKCTMAVIHSLCQLESGTPKDPDDIKSYHRDCIFRLCSSCGMNSYKQKIIDMNCDWDMSKVVVWHKWMNIKRSAHDKRKGKKFSKVFFSDTLEELLDTYTRSLMKMSTHIFNFRWQGSQFEECKKNLQYGDVLMVMDFAQNFTHKVQDEPQGAHWHRTQTTLHPIVCYFRCPMDSCNSNVTDEVLMISPDLLHDNHAVETFFQKVREHLINEGVTVRRIIRFTDNCATQYKSCKTFEQLSNEEVPIIFNYSGANHGKADADSVIGRVSQQVTTGAKVGDLVVHDAKTMALFCEHKLGTLPTKPGACAHRRRHFYHIEHITREDKESQAKTLKQTLKQHCVRNTGVKGYVEVRESSCFCAHCFLGVGEFCQNKHLVLPFSIKCILRSNSNEKGKVKNKLWPPTNPQNVTLRSSIVGAHTSCSGSVVCVNKKKKRVSRKECNTLTSMPTYTQVAAESSNFRNSNVHITERVKSKSKSTTPRIVSRKHNTHATVQSKPMLVTLNTISDWENAYKQMQKTKTFHELQNLVKTMCAPKVESVIDYANSKDCVDYISLQLLNELSPLQKHSVLELHVPFSVYGDGNCFPRALSRLCYGNESNFTEMRCRLVIEMVENKQKYLDHTYLMREAIFPYTRITNIASQYCIYSEHFNTVRNFDVHNPGSIEAVYDLEVFSLRKNGTYCGIWQFHAAANVLGRPVYSIYPKCELVNLRIDLHRKFLPHDEQLKLKSHVGIMWTKASNVSVQPNHFVPLLLP